MVETQLINNIDIVSFLKEKIKESSLTPSYGICYGFDKAFIFQCNEKEFTLPPQCSITNNIYELRIFNKKGEIYVYRENARLFSRIRIDEENEEGFISDYYLWGTAKSNSLIEETRGIHIAAPKGVLKDGKKYRIKIKNYFDFDENGKMFIYDSRAVTIEEV